jgi:hypothetical protein
MARTTKRIPVKGPIAFALMRLLSMGGPFSALPPSHNR